MNTIIQQQIAYLNLIGRILTELERLRHAIIHMDLV
jgi:hypothetical protein